MNYEKFGLIDRVSDAPIGTFAFVDIDNKRTASISAINSFFRVIGVRYHHVEILRTKRGWHYAFSLAEKLKPLEIIALQAILGSDPMREAMNLFRQMQISRSEYVPKFWKQRSNILYSEKL